VCVRVQAYNSQVFEWVPVLCMCCSLAHSSVATQFVVWHFATATSPVCSIAFSWLVSEHPQPLLHYYRSCLHLKTASQLTSCCLRSLRLEPVFACVRGRFAPVLVVCESWNPEACKGVGDTGTFPTSNSVRFWHWYMAVRIAEFLDFHPVICKLLKHKVSGTGSIPVVRWDGGLLVFETLYFNISKIVHVSCYFWSTPGPQGYTWGKVTETWLQVVKMLPIYCSYVGK
jgi:hypothetical protein